MNTGDNHRNFFEKGGSYVLPSYIIILIAITLFSCSGNNKKNEFLLEFEGRNVDIKPFFGDFPFSRFSVSDDGSKLLFFKAGKTTKLQWLDLNEKGKDIRNGKDVTHLDFATRNCWSPKYNPKDNSVYWIGDEQNDEIINIYRTSLGSDEVEKLTNVPYIYAWNFNNSGTKIAYVARMGQNEERLDELRILDLVTGKDTMVFQDKEDYRLTWGDICWQPQEKGVALIALKGMNRTFTNIGYLDFNSGKLKILTNYGKPASLSGSNVLNKWLSDEEYYFISDNSGYSNLYCFDLSTGVTKQVTSYNMDVDNTCYVDIKGHRYLFAIQRNPIQTKMLLIDPVTEKLIWERSSDLNMEIGSANGNKVKLIAGATNVIFQLMEGVVGLDSVKLNVTLEVPSQIKKKLIYSEVEKLHIPTFDTNSVTDKPRLIHAYLYKPENPLPKDRQIVMIESFYGGSNSYNPEYQILNQAGIYVLSPSPRGSAGFGRDYAAMNDGDLGGNEIIDIIYTARYISELLDIPPERIGVFGMSHGGYATMRLMTFPGKVNGHSASFPFGFGIEVAGFSDILLQHKTSNIPDWTYLEAGDPVKDSAKLKDRSPINYAAKITGPLLLVHGDHDNRVNVEGSRIMAKVLDSLHKPHVYLELTGLGHGIKGIQNNKKYYQTCFQFIEDMVLNHKK